VQSAPGIDAPASGFYFLDITTNSAATFQLPGQLNVKAGMYVTCGGSYNFNGDGTTPVSIVIFVDGVA
jgi:hypothetical protein